MRFVIVYNSLMQQNAHNYSRKSKHQLHGSQCQ